MTPEAADPASTPSARPGAARVLVADDHAIVRIGLVAVIDSDPAFQVVAQAQHGEEAVALFKEHRPDLSILDLRMPRLDGIEAARAMLAVDPAAAVVVLTSYEGDENVLRALEVGVRGYLLKQHAMGDDLLAAMHRVRAGHRHIPSEVAGMLAERLRMGGLSSRQVEVLKLIAAGRTDREIAASLKITQGTVRLHIAHIVEKLGVAHRAEAVTVALRRGILSLE